jgi:hypothetical protein
MKRGWSDIRSYDSAQETLRHHGQRRTRARPFTIKVELSGIGSRSWDRNAVSLFQKF